MTSSLYLGPDGRWRFWITPADIEALMEAELRKASLFPSQECPVVDLERFIDRHLGARLDQYAPLPKNVLGQTEFFVDEAPRILVNADLTGAGMDDDQSQFGLHGRWRATLAHEAAHVLMHRTLFEMVGEQGSLFEADESNRTSQRLMRCLKGDVLFRDGATDWREVQANRGMAALLMPAPVFGRIATMMASRFGLETAKLLSGSSPARRLASETAKMVGVSQEAARIRLLTLGIVSSHGQVRLEGL